MTAVLRRTLLIAVAIALAIPVLAAKTYLALGDSLAFGYQPNSFLPSFADRAYVKAFADYLGSADGARPKVINLSIPGETSGSYFDESNSYRFLNLNYLNNSKSQRDRAVEKIASERSAGRDVAYVSFALGSNDFLSLIDDQFLSQPFETQKAQIDQLLAGVEINLNAALSELRTMLPNAVIMLPGYYNPYHIAPGSPEDLIASYALERIARQFAVLALVWRSTIVNNSIRFDGREATLTWMPDDVHPRDAGYAVMGSQLIEAYKRRYKLLRTITPGG